MALSRRRKRKTKKPLVPARARVTCTWHQFAKLDDHLTDTISDYACDGRASFETRQRAQVHAQRVLREWVAEHARALPEGRGWALTLGCPEDSETPFVYITFRHFDALVIAHPDGGICAVATLGTFL